MFKVGLPLITAALFSAFILIYFFPNIRIDISFAIILLTIFFIFVYPLAMYSRKRTDINQRLHLFITYASTISTLQVSRALLFRKIASKKIFGEISKLSEKILYLSKHWNLGFARTCRKISDSIPSKIFADFMDRFAVMMDFGQNLETFLRDEQEQILNEYATEYTKSLETIKTVQEIFMSISLGLAFGLTIGLLLPLIMGIEVSLVLKIFVIMVLLLDATVLILINEFIIQDRLCHSMKITSVGMRKVRKLTPIMVLLSFIIFGFLIYFQKFTLLVDIAIAFTPMFIVGFLANREEELISRRDTQFPTLIRSLGSTVEIKNRAVITSLASLRVHDFGILNDLMINLYKRLSLGADKFKSWMYFGAESGSNLINHFSNMFVEAFYLGGNAEKIAEIISDTFLKLLSLRKRRNQLISGFRFIVYGILVGLCTIAYVSVYVVQVLTNIFSQNAGKDFSSSIIMQGVIDSLIPNPVSINMDMVSAYLGFVIVAHAFLGSIIIKKVDGGSPYVLYMDMVIMVWLGSLISVFAPLFLARMMPGFG